MKKLALATALLAVAFGSTAHAQLTTLKHVWTVPGIMSNGVGLDTFIVCTNGGTGTQEIGVETYGANGGFLTAVSLMVAANATVVFGTDTATGITVDGNMGVIVTRGHARIMALSNKGVVCSAFLADTQGSFPTATASLSIVKAFKQKGD